MDLQSQGCKPVTSANAWPTTTSVRIPHKQPTSAGASRTPLGACPLPQWPRWRQDLPVESAISDNLRRGTKHRLLLAFRAVVTGTEPVASCSATGSLTGPERAAIAAFSDVGFCPTSQESKLSD